MLTHLSLAQISQARENTEIRTRKTRGLDDIAFYPFHHTFTQLLESVPDAKFLC